MQDDPEQKPSTPSDHSPERDPAAPPPGGVDWRVFVGVGIALLGFVIVILVATFG